MSLRSWFCMHEHVAIVKTYAEPTGDIYEPSGRNSYDGMRMLFRQNERARLGITTAVVRCQKCGDVQKHEMLGKEAGS